MDEKWTTVLRPIPPTETYFGVFSDFPNYLLLNASYLLQTNGVSRLIVGSSGHA